MARERNPNREKAKQMYLAAKGNIKLIDIAAQLNISDSLIRKWKSQDKWDNSSIVTLPVSNSNVTNRKGTKKNISKEPISEVVKEATENDELTDKQKDFCFYYVKYRNQVKAYMKAYQCSYSNACSHAYEMWNNEEVKKEIDKQLSYIRNDLRIDIQDLIKINMDIVFADMKDYTEWGKKEVETDVVKEDGTLLKLNINYVDFKESKEVDGTIISEVKKGKDGVSIKLLDKGKAIDFLYKHLSFVNEEDKRKLETANKQYQNEKLQEEIKKIKGEDKNNKEPVRIVDDI